MGKTIVEEYKGFDFEDISGCVPVEGLEMLNDFLSLYLQPEYFVGILILKTKYLRNAYKYFSSSEETERFISSLEIAVSLKDDLCYSCFSHGHYSVIFLMEKHEEIMEEFLKRKYFRKSQEIDINNGEEYRQMFSVEMEKNIFFERIKFYLENRKRLLTFPHDADYMYVISHVEVPGS